MGLTKTPVLLPTMLSPLGKACARMDLTAVQDILLKTGYKDDEGADNEVSYCLVIFEHKIRKPSQVCWIFEVLLAKFYFA